MRNMSSELSRLEVIAKWAQERLKGVGKLLLVAETGATAFGWGVNTDVDVHGVYAAGDWFDYVHYGGSIEGIPTDLNLRSVRHVLYMSFYHPSFESIMNLAEPRLCLDLEFCELFDKYVVGSVNKLFFYRHTVDSQLDWYRRDRHPRTALHAYRVLIQPLCWAKTGRIIKNIYRCIEDLGLGLEGPYICREAYAKRTRDVDWSLVDRELENLYKQYLELFNPAYAPSTSWDSVSYREWYRKAEGVIKLFDKWLR